LIDFPAVEISRAELMKRLRQARIATQVHFIPVHLQPYYQDRYGDLSLEGSMRYYARTLSVPLYPALRDTDVDRVVAELARLLSCRS
jgi:dTDP-4-amino-4,6-dideoxygalactose transaminase